MMLSVLEFEEATTNNHLTTKTFKHINLVTNIQSHQTNLPLLVAQEVVMRWLGHTQTPCGFLC